MTGSRKRGSYHMQDWRTCLPDWEREIYERAGYGRKQAFAGRAALLVIDCTISFTGTKPQSMEEAQAEYATSCGEAAWEALPKIRKLLDLFRGRGLPVIYTRG